MVTAGRELTTSVSTETSYALSPIIDAVFTLFTIALVYHNFINLSFIHPRVTMVMLMRKDNNGFKIRQ